MHPTGSTHFLAPAASSTRGSAHPNNGGSDYPDHVHNDDERFYEAQFSRAWPRPQGGPG
jgi:hypothetical protein